MGMGGWFGLMLCQPKRTTSLANLRLILPQRQAHSRDAVVYTEVMQVPVFKLVLILSITFASYLVVCWPLLRSRCARWSVA
jgi:lauroyl/myristoyl acyltransferase